MSDEQTGTQVSELDMLKQRARLMGINFSNNIGLESLKAKVAAKIEGEQAEPEGDDADEQPEVNALEATAEVADQKDTIPAPGYKPQLDHDHDGNNGGSLPKAEREAQAAPAAKPKVLTKAEQRAADRAAMIKEQMKLVRVRIQNLDPKKANLPGEVFTVANRVLGTVKKFIPYGETTDEGYHIPYILYQELESRRFLNIRTTKKNGQIVVNDNAWAKEFAIEVLPPLTESELKQLAAAQIAAGSVA